MSIMSEVNKDLMVVKYGSRALTGDPANFDTLRGNIEKFTDDLAGYAGRLVVVSSGAVFCGRISRPHIEDEAVLSTIGNPTLFSIWQNAFMRHEATSSQILVTHRELDISSERDRLSLVLQQSLTNGVIPIINENDALSSEELKELVYGGDNDGLAAEIAKLIGAKYLVLFTDTEGFKVEGEVQRDLSLAECNNLVDHARGSNRGGGMVTKLNAACSFVEGDRNRSAHIARAGASLSDVLSGSTGTKITA